MKRSLKVPLVVGLVYAFLVAALAIGFLNEPRGQLHILFMLTLPSSLLPLMIINASWPTFAQWFVIATCGLAQWVWVSWRINKFFES